MVRGLELAGRLFDWKAGAEDLKKGAGIPNTNSKEAILEKADSAEKQTVGKGKQERGGMSKSNQSSCGAVSGYPVAREIKWGEMDSDLWSLLDFKRKAWTSGT